MLVIQHRANELTIPITSDAAEIDVHIDTYGDIVVKHDPDASGWKLDYFLSCTKHKKFFVDIKQNLSIHYYKKIIEAFGNRLIGLFDVPFPSAYELAWNNVDFYARLSEYEMAPVKLTNKFWLDPLANWDELTYSYLLHSLLCEDKVMICCPSLHGRPIEECRVIWDWMKNQTLVAKHDRIQGIVTKHVEEARSVLNDNSSNL